MKILFISQYAGTPHLGMVIRNYNWASELTRQGHSCSIIAASYSHYRAANVEVTDESYTNELVDDISFYWVKTAKYNGDSHLGRIKGMAMFHFGLMKLLNNLPRNFDLVIASSPQPFQIFQAKKFSVQCRAKLIYDIRDLWPLTPMKLGGFSAYHPFILALQFAESYALKHADVVTAVPQNSKKYLESKGMNPSKFLAVGNGYDTHNAKRSVAIPECMKKQLMMLKKKETTLIGYCGSLGLSNAMHSAIKATSITKNKNIHLIIVGSGNKKEELISLSKQLRMEHRIHFLQPIRSDQVSNFLTYVDITYAGTLNSELYLQGASLTKLNDYMAASKPVIYAVGDAGNSVSVSGCGISCEAENTEAIATAMDELSAMPEIALRNMGQTGFDWLLKNQTTRSQVNKILLKLNEVA